MLVPGLCSIPGGGVGRHQREATVGLEHGMHDLVGSCARRARLIEGVQGQVAAEDLLVEPVAWRALSLKLMYGLSREAIRHSLAGHA